MREDDRYDRKVIKLVHESNLVPPSDMHAEGVVLGAVLVEPASLDAVADRLKPEHFFSDANKHIYAAMLAVSARGDVPTMQSVRDHLVDAGKFQRIGNDEYLDILSAYGGEVLEPERAADRIIDRAKLRRMIRVVREHIPLLYDSTDAQETLELFEMHVMQVVQEGHESRASKAPEVLARLGESLASEGGIGIQTGWSDIDAKTGGLNRGDLVIVAGRPSMGKSAWALGLADNVASAGHSVAFFSLEMADIALMLRLCCARAGVPIHAARARRMTPHWKGALLASLDRVAELPLTLCQGCYSVQSMRSECRRIKAGDPSGELGLVVIDYLQLMDTEAARGKSREREIAEVTRALKKLAEELNVPVVLLSQLNRAPEAGSDKRPMLSHLRESGAIEQDADAVLLLFREEYYKPDKDGVKGLCEVNIAKQRNGPVGVVKMHFRADTNKFSCIDRHTEEQEGE